MSIESLLEQDTLLPPSPLSKPKPMITGSDTSLFSQMSPQEQSRPKPKGRKKRSTSLLSPQRITILQSSSSKRGRALNYRRSELQQSGLVRSNSSDGEEMIRKTGPVLDNLKKQLASVESESGVSSETDSESEIAV